MIIEPAGILEINLDDSLKMNIRRYWEMEFKPQETKMNDTIERVYNLFDQTFKLLSQKFDDNTRFGIGLSGGLDSRLVVAFAQKYNMKLVPYCVGEKYLFFPFMTNGYRLVKKMVKYFGLSNFKWVQYNCESYLRKVIREVQLSPIRCSNIEIGCLDNTPDFDIMLNGEHGGVFFGEFDFEDVLNYTDENISELLINLLSTTASEDVIMSKDDVELLKIDMEQYVNSLNTKNRYEIYYKYFFEMKGSKSKIGFFETNYGTRKGIQCIWIRVLLMNF